MKTRLQKLIVPTLTALFGTAISGHTQPTALPAAPTLPAAQVISLWNSSGAYSDIAGINYFESWGGWNYAGYYSVPPNVLEYLGVAYGGVGFEADPQAVGGCTNLHVDVYTPSGDSFAVRLVDTSGHTADVTYTAASGVITNGGWIGLDMPISSFRAANAALNLSSIQQLGWIANNPGEDPGADYYIANIYFSAATNIIPPPPIPTPTNAASIPTWPASTVVAMYNSSGTYTDVPLDDWDANWSSATENAYTITNTGPVVLQYSSLQYAGAEFYGGDAINVTACNTMHVDVWTPNANQFGVELVSLDSGTQAAQVNFLPASGTIVSNKWIGLDIPLNQFTAINNSLDLTALQQLLWIDNQAGGGVVGGIFYIDNVYFYSNSVTPPPPSQPTNNAPTAAWPAASVLAMYISSGAYSDVNVNDWNASWSGASEASFTITNTGNVVLQYGGLEYAGVEFYNSSQNQIDASAYNMMHVDIWTPNANQFGLQLVSLDNGGTQAAQVNFTPASGAITSNQWVSLDIPLSAFTNANSQLDLTDLQQLLWIDNQLGGLTGGIFYIDNVYFYSAAAMASPQVKLAVLPAQRNVSFATQSGYYYTVQYKTNLADAVWQNLSTLGGDGEMHMVPDAAGRNHGFYRVWVH
jgi:hypothetical protein